MFNIIDKDKDRRISNREFNESKNILNLWGADFQNSDDEFKKIDLNSGGFILFDEFCLYAIKN